MSDEKKRKLSTEEEESDKAKFRRIFDNEAEENDSFSDNESNKSNSEVEKSDNEEENEEEEEDEEDDSNYVYDEFLVKDDDLDGDVSKKGDKKSHEKKSYKRLKRGKKDLVLDEEDVELVKEYQIKNLKETTKDTQNSEISAEDAEEAADEIAPTYIEPSEDKEITNKNVGMYYQGQEDSDIDDGFIVEDDFDEDTGNLPEKEEKRQSTFEHNRRFIKKDGPTYDQMQEAMEIFGSGYEEFEDDEERDFQESEETERLNNQALQNFKNSFEHHELISSFLTDNDEVVRSIDKPERFILSLSRDHVPNDSERKLESEYIYLKIENKLTENPSFDTYMKSNIIDSIVSILKFFHVDLMEVPFIWNYRRDYFDAILTKDILWQIYFLDSKWELFKNKKKNLIDEVNDIHDSVFEASENDISLTEELKIKIHDLSQAHNSLKLDLSKAEADQKNAVDFVEENEDHTTEDMDLVKNLSESVVSLKTELENMSSELSVLQDKYAELNRKLNLKSKYDPLAVREFIRLFPREKYLFYIESCSDEKDLEDFLAFFRVISSNIESKNDLDSVDSNKKSNKTGKQRLSKDIYKRYRHIPRLRDFIDAISVPACDYGDSLRHGFRLNLPESPNMNINDFANQFVDGSSLRNVEQVIKAATLVIATEISFEPNARKIAREIFRSKATISTQPTEKGKASISPNSEYFGLHYLDRKPVKHFLKHQKTLFIQLLEAKKIGLINIKIEPPSRENRDKVHVLDSELFLGSSLNLKDLFRSKSAPKQGSFEEKWEEVRQNIIEFCLEHFLIPSLISELERDLIREGKEAVIEECASQFENLLKIGPYRVQTNDPREDIKSILRSCPSRPHYPTVATIYISQNKSDPLCMVYLSKTGVMLSKDTLPSKLMSQKFDHIKQFLIDNRPDLILINSSGGNESLKTFRVLEKHIINEVSLILEEKYSRPLKSLDGDDMEVEDDFEPFRPKVLIVDDNVAIIFKNSERSKKLLPGLVPNEAAAICLGRFAQEPLAEYCSIWTSPDSSGLFGSEAFHLSLHPLQSTIKSIKSRLIRTLEYKLVDAVCECGVDLNEAVSNDHKSAMLAFVSGLGLRKADVFKKRINMTTGFVTSRINILERKLLDKIVWSNAAGFLRIREFGRDLSLDPLDDTRIHPECYITYDFAPKICADAIEQINQPNDYYQIVDTLMSRVKSRLEKRMKRSPEWVDLWEKGRPIKGITDFQEEIVDKYGKKHYLGVELDDELSQLDLEDYANDLKASGKGSRKLQLESIKEELRFPFLDLRKGLVQIPDVRMFEICTNESDHSLYVGLKIGGTVTEISHNSFLDRNTQNYITRQKAHVMTDINLIGFVNSEEVTDEKEDLDRLNIEEYLPVGSRIVAVVIGVDKLRMKLELSIRPYYMTKSESWWIENSSYNRNAKKWWEQNGKDPQALFDTYFNLRRALNVWDDFEKNSSRSNLDKISSLSIQNDNPNAIQDAKSSGTQKSFMRVTHHPLFVNLDYKATEDKMMAEGKGTGAVLVRPSSKGKNFLTITWAFQDGLFKHISVEERGEREGNLGLASQLYILESDIKDDVYSDLDEIYARYIEPMNELVSKMMSHHSFMHGDKVDVEKKLIEKHQQRPHWISYSIRLEPKVPGIFILTWYNSNKSSSNPFKTLKIEVRPYGYKILDQVFSSPNDLLNWFKAKFNSSSQNNHKGSSESSSQRSNRTSRFGQPPSDRQSNYFSQRKPDNYPSNYSSGRYGSNNSAPPPPPPRRVSRFH